MSHIKKHISALIFIAFSISSTSVLAQKNMGYYSSDINKVIKDQKRKRIATPKVAQKLPKLSSRQLSSVRIKGAIGATASADKAVLSKKEIEKLELAKSSEKQSSINSLGLKPSKAKVNQQVFNITKLTTARQGAYSGNDYQGSYKNIKGQAEISARLAP